MLYQNEGISHQESIREHPWTDSALNPDWKYYDFNKNPELIRTSLEDFVPWEKFAAVEEFYKFLEWMHGDESKIESNDCRLSFDKNKQKEKWNKEYVFHGGIFLLFKNLEFNLSEDSGNFFNGHNNLDFITESFTPNKYLAWFEGCCNQYIRGAYPGFSLGCLTFVLFPSKFNNASPIEEDTLGYQPCFRYWAWGDDENEAMENLHKVFEVLAGCVKAISAEIPG